MTIHDTITTYTWCLLGLPNECDHCNLSFRSISASHPTKGSSSTPFLWECHPFLEDMYYVSEFFQLNKEYPMILRTLGLQSCSEQKNKVPLVDSTADHSHRWTASWTAALTRSKALMVSKLNSVEILCKDLNSSGWWLNQPIWKIFVKLDHETPRIGINMKHIGNHHLSYLLTGSFWHTGPSFKTPTEKPLLGEEKHNLKPLNIWQSLPPKRKGPVFPMIFQFFSLNSRGCFLTQAGNVSSQVYQLHSALLGENPHCNHQRFKWCDQVSPVSNHGFTFNQPF